MATNGLKAQIEISADATGVETGVGKAKRSLADLGVSAESAGKKASDGLSKVGDGGDKASAKVDRATQNIIGSIQRTTAALESGNRASSSYFTVLAQQRGIDPSVLKPYLDQLDAVAERTKKAAKATADFSKVTTSLGATGFSKSLAGVTTSAGATSFGEFVGPLREIPKEATKAAAAAGAALGKVEMSAKQTAAALRGVPAQFTDIITSLQGGQAPLTVLLQQGGQLKDMFGGIGPAARALGGYVLGLVNPFTIAAAAVGVLTYAQIKGAEEASAYAKAIILTGNAAGTTQGDLNEMAKAVSAVAGTQGKAAAALTALVATSQVGAENLQRFALAAVQFERATGQAIGDTVKQFAELGKAPLDASIKLNESLRHLTVGTYQQIKALEEQGRMTDAARVAQLAYAESIETSSPKILAQLGYIQRAWKAITDATAKTADAIVSLGRSSSAQEELAAARKELEAIDALEQRGEARRGTMRRNVGGAEIAARRAETQQRIRELEQQTKAEAESAAASKRATEQVAARIRFDKDGEQFLKNSVKMEREIAKARNEGAAAGASAAEIESRIGQIREKHKDKGGVGVDKSRLQSDLSDNKQSLDQLVRAYASAERQIDALRAAGLVGESEYYEAKRAFIRLDEQALVDKLQKDKARLEREKVTGKDKIDNNRRIAETEAQIAIARADSASKLELLSIQEQAAVRAREQAFLSAQQAAQDYFDTVNRQQERDLSSFGQGNQRRDLNSGLAQIEERYASQRRELENQRALAAVAAGERGLTDAQRQEFDKRLQLIQEFQVKSIASYEDYYRRRQELEANATLGFKEALQNYFDEAQKLGKQTEALTTKALTGIEDAFVDLAIKGKASFKDLAESIAADIARIAIRQQLSNIAKSLADAASTAQGNSIYQQEMGGGSSSANYAGWISAIAGLFGGRAIGGPVSRGGLYEINERGGPGEILESNGRQYLLAGQNGEVKPAASASDSHSTTIVVQVQATPGMSRATAQQQGAQIGAGINRSLARNT